MLEASCNTSHLEHPALFHLKSQIYLIYLFFRPKNANDAAGRGQHHANHVNSRWITLCLQPNLTLVFQFVHPSVLVIGGGCVEVEPKFGCGGPKLDPLHYLIYTYIYI